MNNSIRQNRRRKNLPVRSGGGMTLVELLAVIVIMTLLAAAALPIIAPAMQNRQVREASRIVNSFLSGARNRAMQTGRPVGVAFERVPGLPEACITMSYAEVPLPYSGDSIGSTIMFGNGGIQALTPNYDVSHNFIGSQDLGWMGTVRVGDLIKFNYIGNTYQLTGALDITNPGSPVGIPPDANGYFTAGPGPTCVWTYVCVTSTDPSAMSVPISPLTKYQIFRAPIRSSAGSVQLPGTAVIDLTCSGFDPVSPASAGTLVDQSTGYPISPWVSTQTFQPIWPRVGAATPGSSPFGGNFFDPVSETVRAFVPGTDYDTSSVTLTFGPSGAVDRLWYWQFAGNVVPAFPGVNPTPFAIRPTQPIHLMVGRRELLPVPATLPAITDPTATDFKPFLNWQDAGNFWVSISPQSGLVTTNEVAPATFTISGGPPAQYGLPADLLLSRQLARQAHAKGGR